MKRRGLETCIDIMEVLQQKALVISVLERKTKLCNKKLHKYLDFLKAKGYIGAVVNAGYLPGNGGSMSYSLEKEGKEFLKGWHNFIKKYDIENLQKQLR